MVNSDYLKDLNNAQKEAVTHLDGPLLIVAGAGSGKTKVLTSRIAHIIDKKKDYPNQILSVTFKKKNGSTIKKGEVICVIKGEIKNILIGERVALNFLSHISGIATQTNKYVKIVKGKCKICCTRKTIPNFRVIQKYAVKIGGGENHRFNLSDEFLIKDNHISAVKNIKDLIIAAVKKKMKRKITVEIDNLKQLRSIIGLKFDRILFDNMDLKTLKKGIRMVKKKYETEASGNINLKNLKYICSSGVDRISVGRITHSAPSIDFKLEL